MLDWRRLFPILWSYSPPGSVFFVSTVTKRWFDNKNLVRGSLALIPRSGNLDFHLAFSLHRASNADSKINVILA